jgi:hypothetical protein|tara:strand:+ start:170 stop:652 length:483 start_codon:yes stop_codon:yes gene_type:complete
MKIIAKLTAAFIFALAVTGCARVSMLPQHADEVSFEGMEGKTGWSKYEQVSTFRGYTLDQVYDAAKVGIGSAGFALRLADKSKRMVLGEHGMTMHDWNVIAGVYLQEEPGATRVKVIVEGSKDIGFSGDVTSDGWPGKILTEMRSYLNSVYPRPNSVDSH